jgi:capsular exopolysaccharide synthesis family protein
MNVRVRQLNETEEFDRLPGLEGQGQPVFDAQSIWRVLVDRLNIILATLAGALILAVLAWWLIKPMYNATAVLMLDQRKNTVADVNAVLTGLPTDTASIQNQIQILTSRDLAATVIRKLALEKDREIAREGLANNELVDEVLKRLKVEQAGLSTTITVSFAAARAERSAEITNAWVEAYIDDQLNTKFEATQKAAEWLSIRARTLATQVQADEAAVQKYKAEHGIVDTGGTGGSLIDQQTASVSTQLITARAELAQKTAAYNRILQLQRSGRAADASEVVASPLIVQLRAQQAELERQSATLSQRYLSKHPKMIDIRAQANDTRGRIAIEVRRIVEGLANDVAIARANVNSLEGSLNQLQSKFRDEGSAAVKLKALQSIAASSRSMHEAILSRMKEVQGQEGIATPDAQIVSRAVAPSTASPRPLSIFGIAGSVGVVLAILFAFIAEGLDPTFRTGEQVGKFTGAAVLASVPEVAGEGAPATDAAARNPRSSFAEAMRGIYLGLTASADQSPRVVLVTSALPGEGKTVAAINLARVAARSGRKVALVDADFRNPSIAAAINQAPKAPGLLQALRKELPLESCGARDPLSGVTVFACNERPSDPADLAGAPELEKILNELRAKFDMVIVDSAPLRPVHDTWSLSRVTDATLLVVQAGRTPRDAVAAALKTLRAMRANVAGIALTRAADELRYDDYLSSPSKSDATRA